MPVVRTWMTLFDCVFIDRDNARQSVMALQRAAEMIQQGKSVIVFPEGTRSKGDRMGEFKAGAFMMAFRAKCPIVPVAIDGSYKAMEAQGVWMRPATVPVTIDVYKRQGRDCRGSTAEAGAAGAPPGRRPGPRGPRPPPSPARRSGRSARPRPRWSHRPPPPGPGRHPPPGLSLIHI